MKFKQAITTILFSGLLLFAGCNAEKKQAYDAFAKCLTDKGLIMYGAYWCPHCAEQKALFDDASQYINYVECDPKGENPQPDICLEKKVDRYPTWIYTDGRRWEKVMTFEELGEITSCTVPENEKSTKETDSNSETATPSHEIKIESAPAEENTPAESQL